MYSYNFMLDFVSTNHYILVHVNVNSFEWAQDQFALWHQPWIHLFGIKRGNCCRMLITDMLRLVDMKVQTASSNIYSIIFRSHSTLRRGKMLFKFYEAVSEADRSVSNYSRLATAARKNTFPSTIYFFHRPFARVCIKAFRNYEESEVSLRIRRSPRWS